MCLTICPLTAIASCAEAWIGKKGRIAAACNKQGSKKTLPGFIEIPPDDHPAATDVQLFLVEGP
jgi:hypothetical protein